VDVGLVEYEVGERYEDGGLLYDPWDGPYVEVGFGDAFGEE